MPELPEVETTRLGLLNHVLKRTIVQVKVRNAQLRLPIAANLNQLLIGKHFETIDRRGKYLLFQTNHGCLIVHLGMSGSLRMMTQPEPPKKHDHVDIIFGDNHYLSYHDPRRFGLLVWTYGIPTKHKLLCHLGVEPLSKAFNVDYLYERARVSRQPIKSLIMNGRMVVGVGNIYANEALFMAGIHPQRCANRIAKKRCQILVAKIKNILQQAIKQGGTTLRDFVNSEGKPGYFSLDLKVYGRDGEACLVCGSTIKIKRLNQRSTFYCSNCQH